MTGYHVEAEPLITAFWVHTPAHFSIHLPTHSSSKSLSLNIWKVNAYFRGLKFRKEKWKQFNFYNQKERNFDYIRREILLPKNRCQMSYPYSSYSLICLPLSTNNGKNEPAFIARERNKQVLNISKGDSVMCVYIYIFLILSPTGSQSL